MAHHDRGILYPARLPSFHRLPPPEPVAELVRWFWIPEWDIAPGRVSRQEVIAFPACNLVVETGLTGFTGPTTRRSHRDLTGRGWAVGALLRPAAVPAFTEDPAALRDGYQPVDLPGLRAAVSAAMTGADGDVRRTAAVAAFADWLAGHVPEPGEEALLANRMADLLDGDPEIRTVSEAAERLGVSVRTLQRIAGRYVGLPPAAMIRRRRLQEAAELLRTRTETDPEISIASMAADLGYADQAHLANDFRSVLGFTPSGYRQRSRRTHDGNTDAP